MFSKSRLSLDIFRCLITILLLINFHRSFATNWTIEYSNLFAEIALDYAAAAYSLDPSPCLAKHNAELVMRAQIPCDLVQDECWVFIALNSEFIVFSVRGTRKKLQLIAELVETMAEPKKKFPSGGSVQHYFANALEKIWIDGGFGVKLRQLKLANPNHHLLFTGHSLGGAIASLASSMFAYENFDIAGPSDLILVTFGQPRVGNSGYAKGHDDLVPNSFRLIHRFDLIAHLPYCYERIFTHQCTPLHNHGPFHHGTEIWYPAEEMDPVNSIFLICQGFPKNEDDECSNAQWRHYDVSDHLAYFGKDVDSHGKRGCTDISNGYMEKNNNTKHHLSRRRHKKRKHGKKKRFLIYHLLGNFYSKQWSQTLI